MKVAKQLKQEGSSKKKKVFIQAKLPFMKKNTKVQIKPIKLPYIASLLSKHRQPQQVLNRVKNLREIILKTHISKLINEKLILAQLKKIKQTSKRGRKKKTSDDLIANYQGVFRWLKVVNYKLYCSYCISYCKREGITTFSHDYDKTFIFIGSTNIKKDPLSKHERRDLHLKATLIYGSEEERINAAIKVNTGKQDIRRALELAHIQENEKPLLPIFKSLYFSAKIDASFLCCEKICAFLEINDVSINNHYRNGTTLKDMLITLSADIQENSLLKEIEKSRAIGLQVDETTIDNNSKKILSFNVKYLFDGEVKNKFLCCKEILNADSESIFNTVKNVLEPLGLYKKLKSISTDGARAFSSKKNGLVGKLERDLSGLISIHCIAHRLNLGVSDGWNADINLKSLNTMIYSLCQLFRHGPNKIRILNDLEMEYLGFNIGLARPIDIRWLTKYKAADRLLQLYPFIVLTLIKLTKQRDAVALSLLKQLKEINTIGHLKILSDLYEIIQPLNQMFQRKSISFSQLEASYKIATVSLSELTVENCYGDKFQNFIDQVIQNDYNYSGVKLTYNQGDVSFLKKRSNDLAKMVLYNLESRFKDLNILKKLDVMNLTTLKGLIPGSSVCKAYGKQEIEEMALRFKFNSQNCLKAWAKLKTLAVTYKTLENNAFWKLALELDELEDIHILIETYLSIPLTTVECERTFSRLNLIKTDLRQSLAAENVSALMQIALNGPELETYDFSRCIQDWTSLKKRYFV